MLYLLVLYVIISCVCFLAGTLFYLLVHKPVADAIPVKRPVIVYLLTGLMVLTGIGQWLVLFTPLNLLLSSLVLAAVLAMSFFFRKRLQPAFESLRIVKQLPGKAVAWTGLGVLLFMILILNAGPTMMDDTESYHIQMIKWAQEYGTVPGIANLHLRYGFNSSWFISIGLLSPELPAINTYVVLNGLVSCWACMYLLEKLALFFPAGLSSLSRNQQLALLLLLVSCLFCWPMIRGNATTCNYDFITTLCVVVLFIETAFSERLSFSMEWLIWPCYLFTIRIINFPLLLLAIVALWQLISRKRWQIAFLYSVVSAMLIVPFLIRNVMLSGYPLFPSMALDIFPVDWKTDRQMMVNIVEYIRYFNRVSAGHQAIATTKSLAFPYWINSWYRFLSSTDRILVTFSLACYAFCLYRWKYLCKQLSSSSMLFFVVLIAQLVSWFLIAPDPRFVYGALLCSILLACLAIPSYRFLSRKVMAGCFMITCSICFVYAALKLYRIPSCQNYILPYRLPEPPVETIHIDNIEMHIPKKILNNWNVRCYGTEVPCLYRVHPALRARGNNISDGFYLDSTVHAVFDNKTWY
jgi:hypothetical protein